MQTPPAFEDRIGMAGAGRGRAAAVTPALGDDVGGAIRVVFTDQPRAGRVALGLCSVADSSSMRWRLMGTVAHFVVLRESDDLAIAGGLAGVVRHGVLLAITAGSAVQLRRV